jgi:hypothetical protein
MNGIGPRLRLAGVAFVVVLGSTLLTHHGFTQSGNPNISVPADQLAAPERFASIANVQARSAAVFIELGKVLTSPRCTNCHPATDRPRQGDNARLHQPPVVRGPDGMGLESMRCNSCHQSANFEPARVPGHPHWHLAPAVMAWEGKTIGQICRQVSDPARNGGRTLAQLVEHIGDDTLVGWAWQPGFGRTPAPGTQREAKALVETWIATGAACPD